MPKHPKIPHLFEVLMKKEASAQSVIVRAGSASEARDFVLDRYVAVKRLSPSDAFRAGAEGLDIENAKPEYAALDDDVVDDGFELIIGPRPAE